MKKAIIVSSGIAMLAITGLALVPNFVGAQSTNGNGSVNGGRYGYSQSLTTKSEALGMTSDELSTALETKTLAQIAEEKGVSLDALHEKMQSAAQARWAENGLTQEEIDERAADMTERQADCDGTGTGTGGMHQQRHGNR